MESNNSNNKNYITTTILTNKASFLCNKLPTHTQHVCTAYTHCVLHSGSIYISNVVKPKKKLVQYNASGSLQLRPHNLVRNTCWINAFYNLPLLDYERSFGGSKSIFFVVVSIQMVDCWIYTHGPLLSID